MAAGNVRTRGRRGVCVCVSARRLRSLYTKPFCQSCSRLTGGTRGEGFVNAGIILDGASRHGRMTRQDERRDRGESAGSLSDSNMFEELH